MKASILALAAASATTALAQPHLHRHRHAHPVKRDVTVTNNVPGPTAYAYILDGEQISVDDVCKGLKDGELKFADGKTPDGICNTPSSTTTSAAQTTTAAATSSQAAEFYQKSSSAAAPAASSWSEWNAGTGVNSEFPDGTIDCGTFPSSYGAIALDYLNFGGWAGLQGVSMGASAFNDIVTGIAGDNCKEGFMCSYACPPGYQKSQWPSTQGATGQSVGGLQCTNGKLHLTNPSLSKQLCIPGTGDVKAQNKASGVVAICRTDYPGTENMVIPVELSPGETNALTCPNAASYYEWQGKSTSAQYYLNPIGTDAKTGCQWGQAGGNVGNFAPINFGVGAKDGTTWLSIFQNAPTSNTKYQGTVEIQGNLSGTCKYENGQFCGVTGCNDQGCTVSIISGDATYVIS